MKLEIKKHLSVDSYVLYNKDQYLQEFDKSDLTTFTNIVTRCNIHEELIEALKDLVHAHENKMGSSAVQLRIAVAKDVLLKSETQGEG